MNYNTLLYINEIFLILNMNLPITCCCFFSINSTQYFYHVFVYFSFLTSVTLTNWKIRSKHFVVTLSSFKTQVMRYLCYMQIVDYFWVVLMKAKVIFERKNCYWAPLYSWTITPDFSGCNNSSNRGLMILTLWIHKNICLCVCYGNPFINLPIQAFLKHPFRFKSKTFWLTDFILMEQL